MAWVKFTADFDWNPPGQPRVFIAFKEGSTFNVTHDCEFQAIACGKAKKVKRPKGRRDADRP